MSYLIARKSLMILALASFLALTGCDSDESDSSDFAAQASDSNTKSTQRASRQASTSGRGTFASGATSGSGQPIPAKFTKMDGSAFDNKNPPSSFVCTVDKLDVSGSPATVKLSYDGPLSGDTEVTAKYEKYHFFVHTNGSAGTGIIHWGGTSSSPTLQPLALVAANVTGAAEPGLPIFMTDSTSNLITTIGGSKLITCTIPAAPNAPSTVDLAYKGPIFGPSEAEKQGSNYVFTINTKPVSTSAPSEIYLGGTTPNHRANGPTVIAPLDNIPTNLGRQ